MPARRPVAAAASAVSGWVTLGTFDDFGQQAATAVRPSASITVSSYWRVLKLPKVKLASDGSVARTPVRFR